MEIVIERRYCGPPESGNGGYVAGLLGELLGAPTEVRLQKPPPMERPLSVRREEDGSLSLQDGDESVAVARAREFSLDVPQLPEPAAVHAASKRFPGFEEHPFRNCFVCGPDREPGDGLRVFAGPIEGSEGLVGAPWTPHESLCSEGGDEISPAFLWAALDCPGYFAADPDGPGLLGSISAVVDAPLRAGEPCSVIAWPLSRDGRKHVVGSAVVTESGRLIARARGLWIELRS